MEDAALALDLLLTEDPDEALRLAQHADEVNRRRQDEDRRTLDQALEGLEAGFDPERDWGVVLAGEGWHPGVIGIVASRVVERIHRPVVLVALDGDAGRGSARSIPGLHLHRALSRCSDRLGRFGGHAAAAGMDVAREDLDGFRQAFNEVVREMLDPDHLRPRLRIDLEAAPGNLTLELADRLRHLGPHGIGNPRPVFVSRGLEVDDAREVGRGHLKLRLRGGGATLEAIGFNLVERFPPEAWRGARTDVVFQLTVNEYRGRRSPQLKLLDLRRSGSGPDVTAPGGAGGSGSRGDAP
jgi:single-stranded-DNA-specific exonuclease